MSTISVRRLTVNCEVSRDHPNPESVRWRIEEIAQGPLRRALEAVLEPLSRWEGDEVIVLKRLETSFDLDISSSVDESARRWAAKIAKAIVGVLQDGPQATGVARFRSEAEFLGRFLVDRADGCADGKWFYRRYAGLAPLPRSAALRTALLDDLQKGVLALRTLTRSELERVVLALGDVEAKRIVETWGKGAVEAGELAPAIEETIEDGEVGAPWDGMRAPSPWELAVMFVGASRSPVAAMRLAVRARAAAAVAGWVLAEKAEGARGGEAGTLVDPAKVLVLPPESRARLEARLGIRREPASFPLRESTPFGGLLLLFRHLAELPITEAWSTRGDRALARLQVLSRCAGPGRSGRVREDRLLRRLLDVPPDLSTDRFQAWSTENAARFEEVFPSAIEVLYARLVQFKGPRASSFHGENDAVGRAAEYVLCAFSRRLPGFSESSPEYLYENFLTFSATVEEVAGAWVCRVGRPPLGTVLHMTGALRGNLEIPWLEGRSLRLEAS